MKQTLRSFSRQFFNFQKIPKSLFCTKQQQLRRNIEDFQMESAEDKDLRYEDELFFFEKHWDRLEKDKIEKHQDYFSKDISAHQKREVDTIIEKLDQFDEAEKLYFWDMVKEYSTKVVSVDFEKANVFDRDRQIKVEINSELLNPNFMKTQKVVSYLAPFIASGYFSGGAGSQVAAAAAPVEQEKPKGPPKPIEKAKYDIKLKGFDAAKKIALIKEVRALLNLGLKEAKEMVEKVPVNLMKDIKKEEADQIKSKLEENGASIELV